MLNIIFMTLLGIGLLLYPHRKERKFFVERLWQAILKALREAREETNWTHINQPYEEGVKNFVLNILIPGEDNLFLNSFIPFQKIVDRLGRWNALSAVVLKIGSCGVVDIYQGTELWNYHLVDPDNRQAIDYVQCQKLLDSLRESAQKHLKSCFCARSF